MENKFRFTEHKMLSLLSHILPDIFFQIWFDHTNIISSNQTISNIENTTIIIIIIITMDLYTMWYLSQRTLYLLHTILETKLLSGVLSRWTRLCQNKNWPTTNAKRTFLLPFMIAEMTWPPILEFPWWLAKEWGY